MDRLCHRSGNLGVVSTLPCAQPVERALVRAAGDEVRTMPALYDGAAKTATLTLPAGLRSPTAIALREAKGVDLSDVEPPLVREIRIDGQPQPDADTIELFLAQAPKLVEVTLEDARNPVDLGSVRVEAGLRTVFAGEPGVDVQANQESPRRATVRLAPANLIDFKPRDVPTTYSFRLTADDLAIDDRQTARDFRFIIGPPVAEGAVYLSDLEPTKAFAHAGVKRDTNYLGGPIRLAGSPYRKGLMVCPERTSGPVNYGEAIYRIPRGQFKVFRAVIGIEDSAGGGKVKFAVQLRRAGGQWERAFESGVVAKGQEPQGVRVSLGDADAIRLYTDALGSIGCDHALFANARFEP